MASLRWMAIAALLSLCCSSESTQTVAAPLGALGDECDPYAGGVADAGRAPSELVCHALADLLEQRYPHASQRPGLICGRDQGDKADTCRFVCGAEEAHAVLCAELGGTCDTRGFCL